MEDEYFFKDKVISGLADDNISGFKICGSKDIPVSERCERFTVR